MVGVCAAQFRISKLDKQDQMRSPVCERSVAPVLYNSLRPYGLQPARLLCPWDSPGKNTGESCHALLRGDLPYPGIELTFLVFPGSQVDSSPLSHRGTGEKPWWQTEAGSTRGFGLEAVTAWAPRWEHPLRLYFDPFHRTKTVCLIFKIIIIKWKHQLHYYKEIISYILKSISCILFGEESWLPWILERPSLRSLLPEARGLIQLLKIWAYPQGWAQSTILIALPQKPGCHVARSWQWLTPGAIWKVRDLLNVSTKL